MAGRKRKDHQRQQQQQTHRKTLDPADEDDVISKKRSHAPKSHQSEAKLISSNLSSKILKQALNQQREIEKEAEDENPNPFSAVNENPKVDDEEDEEEDIDGFNEFSETLSLYEGGLQEIDEEDEKVLAAFMSENAGSQLTLSDIIIQKIKEKDAEVGGDSDMFQVPTLVGTPKT